MFDWRVRVTGSDSDSDVEAELDIDPGEEVKVQRDDFERLILRPGGEEGEIMEV
jgi:hypothetical protein